MTNIDLLKQRLSILASSSVLSVSAVITIDEAIATMDEQQKTIELLEYQLAVAENNLNYYVNGNN